MIRYSQRKHEAGKLRLKNKSISAFSLDRLNNINNFETGLSGTFGFDYKVESADRQFDFSVAQVINDKEKKKCIQKQV